MLTIIKDNSDGGAWWYKTPMDAYKDLQDFEFGELILPDRQTFIDGLHDSSEVCIGGLVIFIAYEG